MIHFSWQYSEAEWYKLLLPMTRLRGIGIWFVSQFWAQIQAQFAMTCTIFDFSMSHNDLAQLVTSHNLSVKALSSLYRRFSWLCCPAFLTIKAGWRLLTQFSHFELVQRLQQSAFPVNRLAKFGRKWFCFSISWATMFKCNVRLTCFSNVQCSNANVRLRCVVRRNLIISILKFCALFSVTKWWFSRF